MLIHGFGGSCHDWDGVIDALPDSRPLIAYDQRGFGRSTVSSDPYSHADDLRVLLDALGITKADLCGLSLGGATALGFALDHPGRVRRLVLVSPLMVGWTWSDDWIARWKAIGRAARSGDLVQARTLWWRHPLFDSLRTSPAAETMRVGIAAYHGQQWVNDPQHAGVRPDAGRLGTLSAPTLLLTGRRDITDFSAIAQAIGALAPHVTRVDYPEAGHMLNLEIPQALAAEIEAFLVA